MQNNISHYIRQTNIVDCPSSLENKNFVTSVFLNFIDFNIFLSYIGYEGGEGHCPPRFNYVHFYTERSNLTLSKAPPL